MMLNEGKRLQNGFFLFFKYQEEDGELIKQSEAGLLIQKRITGKTQLKK